MIAVGAEGEMMGQSYTAEPQGQRRRFQLYLAGKIQHTSEGEGKPGEWVESTPA